jgi:ankyrin repeat protein
MNYYKKYLKYKDKYYQLKIQNGGNPELFQAIEDNDIKKAKKIIDTLTDLNMKNEKGIPILILSILNGSYKIAELLLEKGADKNIIDDVQKRTLLMHSLSDGVISFGKLLILKYNVDINFENEKKESALFFSTINGLDSITQLLLDRNVKVNPDYNHKFSPLFHLIDQRKELLAIKLIEKGGLEIENGFDNSLVIKDALILELPNLLEFLINKNYDSEVSGKLYDSILTYAEYQKNAYLIELINKKIIMGNVNVTYGSNTVKIKVNNRFSVAELKDLIAFKLDVNISSITLLTVFAGKTQEMNNIRGLSDYGLGVKYPEITVNIVPKLSTGISMR